MQRYALSAAIALLGYNGSAQAQDPATGSQIGGSSQAASEGSQEGRVIEDIVVTATRRAESLQDVPVAVTALSQETLRAAGAVDVRTLTTSVPGFYGGRAAGAFQPVIRGVGSNNISIADESNIATYVDGVYQGDVITNWVELVEVERIEVLRGPQGTIFGRNATGGLINVITPDPSFTTRGRLTAEIGGMRNDAGIYDISGYATGGLSETVAADFAFRYRKVDGFVEDLVRGGADGGQRVVNIRGKLLFQPSDSAELILTGAYVDKNSSENVYQPYQNNTLGRSFPGAIVPAGPWQYSADIEPALDTSNRSVSLSTSIEIGSVNLETTTSYMRNRFHQDTDSDSSNIFLGQLYVVPPVDTDVATNEIRLLSAGTGAFQWILGTYAFYLEGDGGVGLINRTNPSAPLTERLFTPDLSTLSFAGFGEGTYELLPGLFATVGARYTWEERTFEQGVNGRAAFPGEAKMSFDKLTYRLGLRYELSPAANVYVTYSTGFKSGVYNFVGVLPIGTDPETISAFEGGIKADPLSWLRANFAFYYYDYKDLQVSARDPTGPGYVLQNAATAEIYGGELEVTALINENLSGRLMVAYNHADYKSFPGAQAFIPLASGGNLVTTADVSGNQMIRAPRWTAAFGPSWRQNLGNGTLGINANVYYSSTVYYDFLNLTEQEPYATVGAEISWTTADERWLFSLWGQNLTNAKVFQEIRPGAFTTDTRYEMPRRLGVRAQINF